MHDTPEFIQNIKDQFESETQPFRKVHLLIDLCEAVIKFHTVVIVSNFMESKEIPDIGRGLLASGLKSPSLGIWAFFTEKIYPLIPREQLFWEDFPRYYKKTLRKYSDILIPFRNHYAHGSTPDDEDCLDDIQKFYPYLESILNAGVIGRESIEVGERIKGSRTSQAVLLKGESRSLNLSPLLVYRDSEKNMNRVASRASATDRNQFPEALEGTDTEKHSENVASSSSATGVIKRFFYFNDLRNEKKISLLNYDASEHIRDEELKRSFDEVFPLKAWEKKSVSPFKARIEELTENFKGRQEELKKLESFFKEKTQGHFFIWGGPGIGKSALVARALQLSRASQEKEVTGELESFSVEKSTHFIEYFIRRSTDHAYVTTYLKYMSEALERIHSMCIPTGNNQDEMGEKYFEKLRTLSEKLEQKNEKLVLFLDGLDEANEGFLRYLPTERYKNILVVFSTREVPITKEVYLRILLNKDELRLEGLGRDVIRALLYDVVDKYEIKKEYIDGILMKSEGNPLYLKLLLNSLAEKEKKVNDLSALPKGVYDFYQEILDRLQKSSSGIDIYKVLYLLTITKDYLSCDTIAYFTGLDRNKVDMIISDIREILFENPFTTEIEDYQLYHESLRDFFKEKYPRQLSELRENHLLPKLRNWKTEYDIFQKNKKADPYTIRYLLSYTITHLLESEHTIREAEELVLNKDFLDTQLNVLHYYTIPLRDSGMVLKQIISELGGEVNSHRPIDQILKPKKNKEEKFRTTTFVQLVNHTGELSHKASTDIDIAWIWVEEGKVKEALERLSPIQDKQRLFDCYLYALWLLTLQEDGEDNRERLGLVLEEIEKNIPYAEQKNVKWHERFSVEFVADVFKTMMEREQNLIDLFSRGDDEKKKDMILDWLRYEKIGEKEEVISRNAKNIVLLARKIEGNYFRSFSLNIIFESYRKLGDIEFGTNLFLEAVEVAGRIEDPYYHSGALESIVASLVKIGDIDFVNNHFPVLIEVAQGIDNSRYRSRALMCIVESVSKLIKVELAKSIFPVLVEAARNIEDPYSQSRAFSSIGESIYQMGYEILGTNLIQEAFKVAQKEQFLLDKNKALIRIAEIVFKIREASSSSSSQLNKNSFFLVFKLGDVEFGKNFFPVLVEAARGIEDPGFRSSALSSIGESVSKFGDVELGKIIFHMLLEIARGIEDFDNRSRAINSLGESVAKQGDMDFGKSLFLEALEVACGIEDPLNRSQAIYYIGESVVKQGDMDFGKSLFLKAVEVAYGIEDSNNRTQAIYDIGISVFKLGNDELGKNLFPVLVDAAHGMEDPAYRNITLSIIGQSVAKLGDDEFGRNFFPILVEAVHGIEDPDHRCRAIRSIGQSVAEHIDVEFRKNIFQVLVGAARKIDDSNYCREDDPFVYKLLVEADHGIKSIFYRSRALSGLGGIVAKFGVVEFGKKLFQEALEVASGIEDPDYHSRALSSIGQLVSKLRNVEFGKSLFLEAIEISRGIESSNYRSSLLCSIGESVSKLGDVELGKNLFHEVLVVASGIESSNYRSSLLCSIGESVSKLGDVEFGNNFFPMLVEAVRWIEFIGFRSSAICSISESVAKLGVVELGKIIFPMLIEVALGIEDSYYHSRAIISIGKSVAKLGDDKFGNNLFPVLVDVARRIDSSYYHSRVIISIGESVSELGDVEFGMNLLQEALEVTSRIEDPFYHSGALKILGEAVAKLGDLEFGNTLFQEALEVASGIEDPDYHSRALRSIGQSVAEHIDVEFRKSLFLEAIKIARGIEDSERRSIILERLGESISELGEIELGKSIFQEALEVARGIVDSQQRSSALKSLGETVAKLGDVEFGKTLFHEAIDAARGIENTIDRSNYISLLGETVASLGESELTLKLFSEILEMGYKFQISKERKNILTYSAKITTSFNSIMAYQFFESNHESHPDISDVVKTYTQEIRNINWEEPKSHDLFSYYIRTYAWVPYDAEFAKAGAYDMISTLANLGKVEEALEAARGIGILPEELKTSVDSEYERELSELNRLLEEEEITKKGYDKRVDELKKRYGVGM
ncbi:MAG: ATP-binding protein [Leptospiraceae bacterium]|nr:ATP-binding protein [Leptospiraceae bacterium]